MKKVIIGGIFAIIGMMGMLSLNILSALNMASGWSTPPGRFFTTLSDLGITALWVASLIFLIIGIVALGIEYFRKSS